MRGLGKLRRHSTFFYNIFIPVSLIGSVLILGFGSFIYHRTFNSIQDTLIQNQQSFVDQVRGNLDQKIQMVEYAFSTYSNTAGFEEVMNQKLSIKDHRQVKEINSQLAYISVMGIDNAEYQLINVANHWKIHNGSLKQMTDAEVREMTQVANNDHAIQWVPQKDYLSMIITLPIYRPEVLALGVAEIDYRTIDQLVTGQEDPFFTIFSKDGELLYAHQPAVEESLWEKIHGDQKKQGLVVNDSGDTYIYVKSDYNQWVYVTRLSHQTVFSAIRGLRWGLVLICGTLLLLFILFAYRMARIATYPINRINDLVKPRKTKEKLEVNQLISEIDTILVQNHDLARTVEYQKPELATLFFLNLFRGCIAPEEVPSKLAQFEYTLSSKESFAVMLIQIDDLCGRDAATTDLFLLAIENLVSEIIPENHRFRPIVSSQDTQGTILRLSKGMNQKLITSYCKKIQKAARDYLRIKISVGISNSYPTLSDSKLAVDNAKEALHYRIHLGEEVIIFFDDISAQLDESAVVQYPKETERLLFDAMRGGDTTEVQGAFRQIIREIFQENQNPITIENALFRLVNNVVQLGQLLGADYTVLQKSRKIYMEVLNQNHPDKIEKQIYHELITAIVDNIQTKTDREMRTLSDKIVVLVHQQYDQEISLDLIAAQLHYNANYLSNVFKKEMGINFADYLQNYRLQVAKTWLKESNYTIKEISERLKYTNPQNFIRFFKKKEQMTPGEYRKNHRI
ncbi:helix-turn-helix domain-containing protein [Enterococcus sp.]|uniref:helix-turn-helix domain-containing protein n=1 Tax=Enterococcus sp. TaxID=35783 RepID=UPI0025C66904|nr:helix-turn-helix domain-containing protein [Enterococcus sp.]